MKKTLTIRPGASATDPATPKGKKTISSSRLDRIHDLAREQRRFPTDAETVLAKALAEAFPALLFKRKAVAGSVIADFQCRQRPLALMLSSDPVLSERADRQLTEQRLTVLRLDPQAVVADVAGAVEQVRSALASLAPPRPARFARPSFSPRGNPGNWREGGRS